MDFYNFLQLLLDNKNIYQSPVSYQYYKTDYKRFALNTF